MVSFNFALEANNLCWIFDLSLALLILVNLGILLVVGDKPKSSLVMGAFFAHSTYCQVLISLHEFLPSLSSKKGLGP
jgi:hypothetical protein